MFFLINKENYIDNRHNKFSQFDLLEPQKYNFPHRNHFYFIFSCLLKVPFIYGIIYYKN